MTYIREGGQRLDSIATFIGEDVYLDGQYNIHSNGSLNSDMEIYDYESNIKKQCTGDSNPIQYSENKDKYYLPLAETQNRISGYILWV